MAFPQHGKQDPSAVLCPLCDGEKNLFYYADGTVSHWGRPPHVPRDCPALIGKCWLCGGRGTITGRLEAEYRRRD